MQIEELHFCAFSGFFGSKEVGDSSIIVENDKNNIQVIVFLVLQVQEEHLIFEQTNGLS